VSHISKGIQELKGVEPSHDQLHGKNDQQT